MNTKKRLLSKINIVTSKIEATICPFILIKALIKIIILLGTKYTKAMYNNFVLFIKEYPSFTFISMGVKPLRLQASGCKPIRSLTLALDILFDCLFADIPYATSKVSIAPERFFLPELFR